MINKLPKSNSSNQRGFTLVELLVVIGVLTILLSIVLIAINPARQFSQANNTQRRSDVNAMLNAVHEYAADNNGSIPAGITAVSTEIGDGVGELDICSDLVPTYVAELPIDPTAGTGSSGTDCTGTHSTGYEIQLAGSSNRITVSAPSVELGESISVTR